MSCAGRRPANLCAKVYSAQPSPRLRLRCVRATARMWSRRPDWKTRSGGAQAHFLRPSIAASVLRARRTPPHPTPRLSRKGEEGSGLPLRGGVRGGGCLGVARLISTRTARRMKECRIIARIRLKIIAARSQRPCATSNPAGRTLQNMASKQGVSFVAIAGDGGCRVRSCLDDKAPGNGAGSFPGAVKTNAPRGPSAGAGQSGGAAHLGAPLASRRRSVERSAAGAQRGQASPQSRLRLRQKSCVSQREQPLHGAGPAH